MPLRFSGHVVLVPPLICGAAMSSKGAPPSSAVGDRRKAGQVYDGRFQMALNETMADPSLRPMSDGGSTRLGIAPPPTGTDAQRPAQLKLGPGVRVPDTPYRITGWLGDGSMGVVYQAEHVDLERRVALKILRPEVSDSIEIADMLRKEAKNASRIDSEYIAEVYDLGELEDGRVWFSMPLLQGRSLDKVLSDEALDLGRVIGILRQICKGLAAAHEIGIIHRDVKPENIMLVTDRGRRDAVRMLDWGIAVLRGEAAHGARVTAGTPYYIAPELIAKMPFDHRVDIYSLGCTAFQMIAGSPPFVEEDLAGVLLAHVDRPAPRLKTFVPEIPAKLEKVIAKCLAKVPDDRFPDAKELEAALCEAQVAARLESTWDDLPLPDIDPERRAMLASAMPDVAGRAPQRSRWFIPAALGAVLALGGAGLGYSLLMDDAVERSSEIETLVRAAYAAAAKSLYIYPPPESPKAETALTMILALEGLDGRDDFEEARAKATVLRSEFGETLARLGDRYWERPGGRPFAIDYYAEALLFAPDLERAKARASLTPGELADLRDKASEGRFSDSELRAVLPLVALAKEDPTERAEALMVLAADDEIGVSTAQRLDLLIEQDPELSDQSRRRSPGRRNGAEADLTR